MKRDYRERDYQIVIYGTCDYVNVIVGLVIMENMVMENVITDRDYGTRYFTGNVTMVS